MKIIYNKNELQNLIHKGNSLGFVPTMGAIHQGHISLIRKSIYECNKTIVTIFVNKPQFNRKRDYQKYPKTLKSDILKLKKLQVNYLYLPKSNQIYPYGPNRKIKINLFAKKLTLLFVFKESLISFLVKILSTKPFIFIDFAILLLSTISTPFPIIFIILKFF